MDPIRLTCNVLDRITRQGGFIGESALPHQDTLTMFRLTNQNFIRAVDCDNGELIFAITEEGTAELTRHNGRSGH